MKLRTGRLVLISLLAASGPARANEAGVDASEDQPSFSPGANVTLDNALRLADERNLSLAAARTDVLRAQAELKTSWSYLLPTAVGTLSFTYNDHATEANMEGRIIELQKQQDLRSSLVVSAQLIDARLWQGIVLGDLGVDVAELNAEKVRQTLLLSVAQAYYLALAARKLVDVQQNQIRSSKRHLAVATIRHRSGAGSPTARLDVVRAQTELLTIREELLRAHTALDNARDALSILLGTDGLPMPMEIPDMRPPQEPQAELLDKAMRQREDLRLAQTLIELADRRLTTSWMQFIPTLGARWQLNQQLSDLSEFGSQDTTRWFIGLTLTLPIYDHARYADLDHKRVLLNRARLDAEYAELNARLEVRRARRNYLTAVKQVASAVKKASLATESLRLSETAYENGTGNSLEVTDARRTSRLADIDLATRRFDAQLSLLTLFRALGMDMRTLGDYAQASNGVN